MKGIDALTQEPQTMNPNAFENNISFDKEVKKFDVSESNAIIFQNDFVQNNENSQQNVNDFVTQCMEDNDSTKSSAKQICSKLCDFTT